MTDAEKLDASEIKSIELHADDDDDAPSVGGLRMTFDMFWY